MAQIDLRHADIYIKDGYAASGTINQPGGYATTTTTMLISGLTGAIPNGSTFQLNGTGTVYTVSSTVGGTTPTSVTFSPGLTVGANNPSTLVFSITGALVNNVSGYAAAATTMLIDGLAVAIPAGSTFTVAGTTGTYTVVSTVGGATPTSVTFTPGLAGSVVDDAALTIQEVGNLNAPSAAPSNGDTTITITGVTKAIPTGNQFTVVGSTASYTVVSTVGGSTPTSITFTPAFASGAGIPANSATVTIGPNILKVKVGEGNLTFSPKRTFTYVREKRSIALGYVMSGDDEPMDVKLDAIWEFLSSDTAQPPTIEEALTQTGNASAWVTAGADPCEPYAVNIEVVYTPPCAGVKSEVIGLDEYRWESLDHDLKAGTLGTSGKCKILLPVKSRVVTPATP